MNQGEASRFRAGDRVEDLCRACKVLRTHTVMAVSTTPPVVRVVCGYCGSHHNYRGGPAGRAARSIEPEGRRDEARGSETTSSPGRERAAPRGAAGSGSDDGEAFPLVTERERRYTAMSNDAIEGAGADLEMMLRRIIREEMGLGPAIPADKWRGGEMILRPGKPGLQEKTWPIETFFHKVVMLRNRLRVLEQQLNGAEIPDDVKVRLQGYITGCYGTLTSFNVLFANEEDRFQGSGGDV